MSQLHNCNKRRMELGVFILTPLVCVLYMVPRKADAMHGRKNGEEHVVTSPGFVILAVAL